MNRQSIVEKQSFNYSAYKLALELYYLNKFQQEPKKKPRIPANDYRRKLISYDQPVIHLLQERNTNTLSLKKFLVKVAALW